MGNKFSLTIKEPCSEKFNQFKPTKSGGYCNSCSKEVVDFRYMNDIEVFEYFKLKNTNTCGYFNKSQLKMYTEKTKYNRKQSFNTLWAAAGFSLVAMLSTNPIHAQQDNKPNIVITENTKDKNKENSLLVDEDYIVKGIVIDESGEPIPGVNIILSNTAIGESTNFDGEFTFPQKLKEGDVLIFSFLGYETKKVIINKNQTPLKVIFKEHDMQLLGKVQVVGNVHKTKRSLWQRVKTIF